MSSKPTACIRHLGLQPYEPIWQKMHHYTHHRTEHCPDELWCLEHSPVFTQGQNGKPEHILNAGSIPVVQTDRGGQVTYHGPGQLVVYFLLDIKRLGLAVRPFVTAIESAVVAFLKDLAIDAYPRADAPGVYINDAKICSLGLRIHKGRSYHGLALNVDMDLSPFSHINPCGFSQLAMTQLKHFHDNISIAAITPQLLDQLSKHLGYEALQPLDSPLTC